MPGQNNEAASLHTVNIGHPYAVVVDSVSFSFMFLSDFNKRYVCASCRKDASSWCTFKMVRELEAYRDAHTPQILRLNVVGPKTNFRRR